MEQYISKSDLIEEIKRLDEYYHLSKGVGGEAFIESLLSLLDTLEVKEVDLKKEIENYLSSYWPNEKELHPFLGHMATQFFELGMTASNKAQKGE